MSQRLRQSLIGFIWPGPVAGPLPVNLFRIASPLLVFYLQPAKASLVMATLSVALVLLYFELLELKAGKQYLEERLQKLPFSLHQNIENKGPAALFIISLVAGVFPYAIFLKLLRYPRAASQVLLVLSCLASSLIWTALVWGSIVSGVKLLLFGGW